MKLAGTDSNWYGIFSEASGASNYVKYLHWAGWLCRSVGDLLAQGRCADYPPQLRDAQMVADASTVA